MDRHLGLNTLASPQFVKHKKPLGWDVKRFYKPKDVLLPFLVHFQWLTDHLKTLTSEHSQQDANHWYAWKTEELDGVGKTHKETSTDLENHQPLSEWWKVKSLEGKNGNSSWQKKKVIYQTLYVCYCLGMYVVVVELPHWHLLMCSLLMQAKDKRSLQVSPEYSGTVKGTTTH